MSFCPFYLGGLLIQAHYWEKGALKGLLGNQKVVGRLLEHKNGGWHLLFRWLELAGVLLHDGTRLMSGLRL